MRKKGKSKAKEKEHEFSHFGKELPRAFDVVEDKLEPDILRGCSKAVIIGVHGWFPGMPSSSSYVDLNETHLESM